MSTDSRSKAWWPLVLLGTACLCSFGLLLGFGRFAQTDEAFFKTAGLEWAKTGRFGAPAIEGFFGLQPPVESIFFVHPPSYPVLFGLWTKVFGFSWRTCVGFDGVVHLILVGSTVLLLWHLGRNTRLAAAGGALVLPISSPARPDELAIAFGLLATFPLVGERPSLSRAGLGGVLLGLTAGTSTGAGTVVGLICMTLLLGSGLPASQKLQRAAVCCGSSGVTFACVIAPVLLANPRAYHQYFDVAATQVFGPIGEGLRSAFRMASPVFVLEAGCIATGLFCLLRARGPGQAQLARLWAGPLLGVLFVLVTCPQKFTYFWFTGPWLVICALLSLSRVSSATWRVVAGFPAAIGGGVAYAALAFSTLIVLRLPEGQRIGDAEQRVRSVVPPGSTVLADEYWWSLAADHEVLDGYFSVAPPGRGVEFAVLTGNGTGEPGRVKKVNSRYQPELESSFETIDDNMNRRPLRLLGKRWTNSAWGFGAIVMKRRQAGAPVAANGVSGEGSQNQGARRGEAR